MQILSIQETKDSPSVILDKERGIFEIAGKFLHEDVMKIFDPVYNWLDQYISDPNPETVFDFKLNYFNTAASKGILDLMMRLKDIEDDGNKVLIQWFYPEEDTDIADAGQEFSEMASLKIKMIPYTYDD
jgi:hypothetical protein